MNKVLILIGVTVGALATAAYAKPAAKPVPVAAGYLKTSVWSDENYRCKNAGEAKKIVQELQKMKKTLAALKESPNLITQNNAFTLAPTVDALIETIPSRVK